MHRVVVLRHAKAEPDAATDHARELAPRGLRDGAAVGQWARANSHLPDVALVSTAARTVGTWRAFAEAAGSEIEPDLSDDLYRAGPEDVLAMLRRLPESDHTALVVGHNPTMGWLVHLLDDRQGDPAARELVAVDYPTSTATVFEVPGEWADLAPGVGTIRAAFTGRG